MFRNEIRECRGAAASAASCPPDVIHTSIHDKSSALAAPLPRTRVDVMNENPLSQPTLSLSLPESAELPVHTEKTQWDGGEFNEQSTHNVHCS